LDYQTKQPATCQENLKIQVPKRPSNNGDDIDIEDNIDSKDNIDSVDQQLFGQLPGSHKQMIIIFQYQHEISDR
jgi:hypothetical protein